MARKPQKQVSVVLPVGGGKGGIGKSAVAANLGLALARLEHRVILVDADLGGSDLHNLLGLDNDLTGLGEVLTSRDLPVAEVVHPVLEPRFRFVPGDALAVATANPSFQKKRKLLHGLKGLDAEFTLLDLGAGTSFTVLDFYLTSPVALLVMLPERPAVLGAFNFLKNAVFRALHRVLRGNAQAEKVLAAYQARSRGPGAMRMEELVAALDQAKPGEGARARKALQRWRPKLVLNRVRIMDDFVYAHQLERWARDDLGLAVEVAAFLPEDDVVRRAGARGMPALDLDARSPFCQGVALLASEMSAWAGRPAEWAAHREFAGSFERAATGYAPLFPPPGTSVPTREELLRRLKELEEQAARTGAEE
jgi:flagellar biosynthesis protein FlhG